MPVAVGRRDDAVRELGRVGVGRRRPAGGAGSGTRRRWRSRPRASRPGRARRSPRRPRASARRGSGTSARARSRSCRRPAPRRSVIPAMARWKVWLCRLGIAGSSACPVRPQVVRQRPRRPASTAAMRPPSIVTRTFAGPAVGQQGERERRALSSRVSRNDLDVEPAPASSSRCVSDRAQPEGVAGIEFEAPVADACLRARRGAANTSRSLAPGSASAGSAQRTAARQRPRRVMTLRSVTGAGPPAARCRAGRPGRRTDVDRVPTGCAASRSPASARRPRSPSGSGRCRGRPRRRPAPSPPPSTCARGSRPCPPRRGRPRSRRCSPRPFRHGTRR